MWNTTVYRYSKLLLESKDVNKADVNPDENMKLQSVLNSGVGNFPPEQQNVPAHLGRLEI